METLVKIDVEKMKAEIKRMAEQQKHYKNQRRTEKIVGKRVMPAWEATHLHQMGREQLRVMYAAYGLARGKSFSQIENHYPEENHPLKEYERHIQNFLDAYKIEDDE